jgi:signal transduction histidine kinase
MLAQALGPFDRPVEVLTANDGLEAWRLIEQRRVDVLITDYQMPGLSGLELIARVRSQHTDTHIILITAHHTPALATAARNLHVTDYVIKPVSPEALCRVVAEVLGCQSALAASVAQVTNDRLAMASHELKTPITTLLAYVDLLKRVGPLTEHQIEYLNRMRAVTKRLSELVRNLVEQARTTGSLTPRPEPCCLVEMAEDMLDEFAPSATARNLTLAIDVELESLYVWGDATALRQVLRNLLGNAIKYTPAGGRITLGVEARTNDVCVWVRDTGLGIPTADLPFIFEKFYRVCNHDRATIEGNGLGLAIVKTIVEQHGGSVSVESELGQGSCFRFNLPALASITSLQAGLPPTSTEFQEN